MLNININQVIYHPDCHFQSLYCLSQFTNPNAIAHSSIGEIRKRIAAKITKSTLWNLTIKIHRSMSCCKIKYSGLYVLL